MNADSAERNPMLASNRQIVNSHFAQLDGLRGIAILAVIFYHYVRTFMDTGGDVPIFFALSHEVGWAGVDLFFVLSGFLITGILWETKQQKHFLKNFYVRRLLRIFPLYYANLVVLLLVAPAVLSPLPGQLALMARDQAWYWLYLVNWLVAVRGSFSDVAAGYLWSLAVEEQFYILWPFVVLALGNKALMRTAACLIVFSMGLRVALVLWGMNPGAVYAVTFSHMDGLLSGALIALVFHQESIPRRLLFFTRAAGAAALLGLIVLRLTADSLLFWERPMALFGNAALNLVFVWMLVEALMGAPASWYRRFLATRFLVSFGKYSYSLYLFHLPIGHVVLAVLERLTLLSDWFSIYVFLVAGSGASWVASLMSWHLFEKHFLALKGKLAPYRR